MNTWRAILLLPWTIVKTLARWIAGLVRCLGALGRRLFLSVRAWVLLILLVIGLLVAYYAMADRDTPLTTDAYVQAYVVQVAPRVEGQVVRVCVQENQPVQKGELLFEIDRRPFEQRVALLTAKRVSALQQVAQMEAELAAVKAEDIRLVAEEAYAKAVHEQEKEIYKHEATTDRKYLDAVQKYKAAQAALERSRAQVRKAEQALAARVGTEHALVAEVEAQLAEARLHLEWTRVHAPVNGPVTNLQLREGSHVHVGGAVLTCIDTDRWFIVAHYAERSLERLQSGQKALVAFQAVPGQLRLARVYCVGWGVSQGQGIPSGLLPEVKHQSSWIPPAQRFQVRLALDEPEGLPLRVGMTASVSIYPDADGFLNRVTQGLHQVIAWFYYL